MATTIIIADGHPLIRTGVKQILESVPYFSVIGEAEDGETALDLIRREKPDIAVLDIQMSKMSGFEIVSIIDEEQLPTRALLLTMYKNKNFFFQAVLNGVKGYILKEAVLLDLIKAVEEVKCGKTFISESLSHFLRPGEKQELEPKLFRKAVQSLSPAERVVLKKITEWKTNNEISADVGISPYIIGSHRRRISEKLNLIGVHSLIRFALENCSRINSSLFSPTSPCFF